MSLIMEPDYGTPKSKRAENVTVQIDGKSIETQTMKQTGTSMKDSTTVFGLMKIKPVSQSVHVLYPQLFDKQLRIKPQRLSRLLQVVENSLS